VYGPFISNHLSRLLDAAFNAHLTNSEPIRGNSRAEERVRWARSPLQFGTNWQCPHRVALDAFKDPAKRDPVAFVETTFGTRHYPRTRRSVAGLLVCRFLALSKLPRTKKEAPDNWPPCRRGDKTRSTAGVSPTGTFLVNLICFANEASGYCR